MYSIGIFSYLRWEVRAVFCIIRICSFDTLHMSTLMPEAREALESGSTTHLPHMSCKGVRRMVRGNRVDVGVIGSSETETDDAEGLMFVPRKKRTRCTQSIYTPKSTIKYFLIVPSCI